MSSTSQTRQFATKFTQFVDHSPTPFHCVAQTVKRLEASGFVRLHECVPWKNKLEKGGKYYYTRNASTIVAFAIGKQFEAGNGFKVIGAHTDSPVLKVKPNAKRSPAHGCIQVGTECYGGGLWHTWFDRDLGIAGRCLVKSKANEGTIEQRLVHITKPILRVPTLCIHLQSGEERAAFKVNKEDHLVPILGLIDETLNKPTSSTDRRNVPELLDLLAKEMSCEPGDIVDVELTLCDTQGATIGGVGEEFIHSPRLDNQMHCFTSVEALADYCDGNNLDQDTDISMVVLFDHEEVGSDSNVGAGSPIMRDAVQRVSGCFIENGINDELFKIGLSKSLLFSADGAHAVHPNYASKHEKEHAPKMNGGTVIKTNDNQRYATNAITGYIVRELARRNNLPIQEFVVRNDCPCGSTIGPIIAANTGIRTVDLGVPQLSMHSIRETCSVNDLHTNYLLLSSFLREGLKIDQTLKGIDG